MQKSLEEKVIDAFFSPISKMRSTLVLLCDCHTTPQADPVTHTVMIMIASPLQIQLTAVGWQPFKGKELTFPYQKMDAEQKEAIKSLLTDETQRQQWGMYEHAVMYRKTTAPLALPLKTLDVLEALCTTVLKSAAYTDKRIRVAVCNILLQRVQASIPVDKNTLRELNTRLFPPPAKTDGAERDVQDSGEPKSAA